jgi:predicted RNase H-like HicB family nuclease
MDAERSAAVPRHREIRIRSPFRSAETFRYRLRPAPDELREPPSITAMTDIELAILHEDGTDGWIIASIPTVPGVLTQGRTRREARKNVLDALALMVSPEPDSRDDERDRELLRLTLS